jgi:DNA-directed RNA polymerase specialized sigma24 family protein
MQPDPSDASVTQWLDRLKAGDPGAARFLWDRYFRHMLAQARARLRGAPGKAVEDEEDVALSAFKSFCRAAGNGGFPLLADRSDLWPLLVTLTERKAVDLIRRAHRLKRGGGAAAGVLDPDGTPDPSPPPDFAAALADECERWLDRLRDPVLRQVAVLRMEGYSVDEVAARLGCVPRTVERKLAVIRQIWEAAAREPGR